jgi:hypothetical protein
MIGRPGRVGVVLGNPKVGLVDMVQQPVEHVRRFAHRRGNDPSMERTVTAGDVRVDHRAGVDAIYFALTEPPAPARPPARKYCPSEDEVVRRALGPARATPPAGPSTRGRHGRRVEARPPVALLERRAAHHGADQQRGRGVPVGHREHRHDHPAGRMMMQMVGVFAEFERAMIRERTSAGLAAARAEGVSAGGGRNSMTPSEGKSPKVSSPGASRGPRWRAFTASASPRCRASSPCTSPDGLSVQF